MFSPSKRALSMQESAIRKLDQSVAAQKDVTDLMEAMKSMATDNAVLGGGR